MTRKGLNKVLIEAVKKSVTLDNHRFPELKMFAEIGDIMEMNDTDFGKNSRYTPGSDYFYSNKGDATGNSLAIEYPALLLIETGANINMPFSSGSKSWEYTLNLAVVYPVDEDGLYKNKPIIHKEEVTKFCLVHLDWVLNYISEYLKEQKKTQLVKKLEILNPQVRINLNDNIAGKAAAWIEFRFPECVEYDFQKNTRKSFCCGSSKPDIAASAIQDDTGQIPIDDSLQFIILD